MRICKRIALIGRMRHRVYWLLQEAGSKWTGLCLARAVGVKSEAVSIELERKITVLEQRAARLSKVFSVWNIIRGK